MAEPDMFYPKRHMSPSSMSLREKTLKKRQVNKEHNSNFRAGYVQINEEYLHKTGIRGRKRYFIYCLVVVIALTAIVNLLILLTLLGTLRISKDGMEALEFISPGRLVRFLVDSDMGDNVTVVENEVKSLPGREINITGVHGQAAYVRVRQDDNTSGSSVSVHPDKIQVTVKEAFKMTDQFTGKEVFSTNFETFKFPDEMNSLSTDEANTHRVTSGIDSDLTLSSEAEVTLRGSEGLTVKTSQASLNAKRNIDLSTGQSIVLDSERGIFFEQARQLAYAPINEDKDPTVDSYKVCVCMPSGKLFAVPPTLECHQANEETNPCLT